MTVNKTSMRYMGLFDRGYGRECIEIKLDYPFRKSGVYTQPSLLVYITGVAGYPPNKHAEVVCILVRTQEEFAKALGISQQDVSDCLTRHRDIQARLGRM